MSIDSLGLGKMKIKEIKLSEEVYRQLGPQTCV
jgi:hypothetical protein